MNLFLIMVSSSLTFILVFILGFLILFLGFIFGFIVSLTIRKTKDYSGIMKIIRNEDKVVYSLELHEDPIMLEHKREIVFKVDTSDQSSDRK